MAEQTFWPFRDGETLYHCSSYGLGGHGIATGAGQKLEFKIFNGKEGQFFTFSIGLLFASHPPDIAAATVQPFAIQDGFGWLKPPTEIPQFVPPDFPQLGASSLYYREGLTVELFRPGEDNPYHTWEFNNEFTRGQREFTFPLTTDEHGNHVFPVPTKAGWWRCRVSHKSLEDGRIAFCSMSFLDKVVLQTKNLSYRWLNHAFENVLGGVTPRVSINGHHVTAAILEEVSSAAGIEPIIYEKDIDDISGIMELATVSATATHGSAMKAFLESERDSLIAAIPPSLPPVPYNAAVADIKERFNPRIEAVGDLDPVIKISPVFSDPTLTFGSYIGGDLVFHDYPVIYINLAFPYSFSCYVDLRYTIEDVWPWEAALIKLSGNDEKLRSLNEMAVNAISANNYSIRKYLLLALGKVAGKTAAVDHVMAAQWGWEVTYYNYKLPDPDFVPVVNPELTEGTHISIGETGGVVSENENILIEPVPVDPLYGVFPDDYRVRDEGSLERLDKIKTIFVIMMENRSFDHFLGFLSREMTPANDESYITFPDTFTNPKVGNLVEPVKPRKASQMGDWISPFVTPVSPEHEYNHVLKQMSDDTGAAEKIGAMQGFTTNIMERFNKHIPPLNYNPQLVMSYFEKEQLPTYFEFAKNFKVLDQWFAAHPGPTWPNRIATVTGELLGLRNFSLTKDDRIGYFDRHTIFDTLTKCGIDWLYMESNLGILRLFDKYRTDDEHVVPLKETDEFTLSEFHIKNHPFSGLQLLLGRNVLPRVVFIDPRFSDLPPLRKACDDLAPTHVAHGQWFLYEVYSWIRNSQHWKDSAILITYDEHGGFFDHVAPPGTSFSSGGKYPKIYRDEPNEPSPEFLGVRVPAFLISPYVDARTVSHVVFDHTSIVKTILVHNRAKIPRDEFELFGSRVRLVQHLGAALDRKDPRTDAEVPPIPEPFPNDKYKVVESGAKSFYTRDRINTNDFAETLRTLFIPNVAKS